MSIIEQFEFTHKQQPILDSIGHLDGNTRMVNGNSRKATIHLQSKQSASISNIAKHNSTGHVYKTPDYEFETPHDLSNILTPNNNNTGINTCTPIPSKFLN